MTPDLVQIDEQFQAPSPLYPHGSYRIKVGEAVLFGTGRWRTPSSDYDGEYSWRAHILFQIDQINRMNFENPPWLRLCKALVKEGPKAMVVYGG
jgi:hypothetical protein